MTAPPNKKHGFWDTRLYGIWGHMNYRCHSAKAEPRYGGRGITVCAAWRNDFMVFRTWALSHGYQEHLTIDRIDNDGNYEPGNCRWATIAQQARNRSNTVLVEYQGEMLIVADIAKRCGVLPSLLASRLRRGWPIDLALSRPIGFSEDTLPPTLFGKKTESDLPRSKADHRHKAFSNFVKVPTEPR